MTSKMHIKKLKSGYAVYDGGKRQTALLPNKKSANIVLNQYKEYESSKRGMRP